MNEDYSAIINETQIVGEGRIRTVFGTVMSAGVTKILELLDESSSIPDQ